MRERKPEGKYRWFWINELRMKDLNLNLNISHKKCGLCILWLAHLLRYQQDEFLSNTDLQGIRSFAQSHSIDDSRHRRSHERFHFPKRTGQDLGGFPKFEQNAKTQH